MARESLRTTCYRRILLFLAFS